MYSIKPPILYRWFLSKAIFRTSDKKVYLTFDDGPDPIATPLVLDILKQHGVKATFFVIGKNSEKYPQLINRIKSEGHALGNHGYEHLDGWTISTARFVENVKKGAEASGSRLFRPPYGRAWPWQLRALKNTSVILWSVLSGDFDATITQPKVVKNVVSNVNEGSIIVMHDSAEAANNVGACLAQIITGIKDEGYELEKLTE